MRKWHRWLVIFFGAFLMWITVTGLLSQVEMLGELVGGEHEEVAAPAAPAGFVCPPDYSCRPKPAKKGGLNYSLLHHLHSGETFGPVGTVIGTLSGFAMLFFSFSGLWMYIQMWRNRKSRSLKPGWFWK